MNKNTYIQGVGKPVAELKHSWVNNTRLWPSGWHFTSLHGYQSTRKSHHCRQKGQRVSRWMSYVALWAQAAMLEGPHCPNPRAVDHDPLPSPGPFPTASPPAAHNMGCLVPWSCPFGQTHSLWLHDVSKLSELSLNCNIPFLVGYCLRPATVSWKFFCPQPDFVINSSETPHLFLALPSTGSLLSPCLWRGLPLTPLPTLCAPQPFLLPHHFAQVRAEGLSVVN